MAENLPQSGVELIAKYAAQFVGDLGKAEKAVDDFGDKTVKESAQVDKAGKAMEGVFQGIGIAVADMAVQGAQALGQFAGDSIKAAGDFQSGMQEFGIAAGSALEEAGTSTEEFRDLFLELGQKLPVSTSEVQAAATTLVKGGLDPMILKLGGLEQSLNFAAAAGMGLEEAADLSVKQLGTFVSSAASAEEQTAFLAQAQDLLVKAAGASTLDVAELGDAMLAAGGTAKAAGVDYADFATTMGLISPSFASAAEAGTSYKNFLTRLTPSTEVATEAMGRLGLLTDEGASKFYDSTGAFIGNQAAAELLQNSLAGLSDAEKSATLETIFGNDAMGAAVALADQGAEGYDRFAKSMDGAAGVSETAAGKQQGFNVALDNFMGSVEALQITIGSALLPVLEQLFNDYISPGVNYLTNLAKAWDTSTDATQETAPWLTKISDIFKDVQTGVQILAAKYLPMLTDTWEDDLLPAFVEGQRFFSEDLMPILSDLADAVLPVLGTAIEVLAAVWENVLVPAVKVIWGVLDQLVIPVLKVVAAWLAEYLPPAVKILAGVFTNVLLPAVKFVLGFFLDYVIPGFRLIGEGIAMALGGAIDIAVTNFNNLLDIGRHVAGAIGDAWNHTIGVLVGAFEGIGRAIRDAIHWIQEIGNAIRGIPPPPEWYRPGSPTPFEMGMRGIAGGTEQATEGVSGFARSMQGLGRVTPDAMPGMGSSNSVSTTYNQQRTITMPVYTNNSPAMVQQSMAYYAALEGGTL